MDLPRSSGLLLHITSLPSPFGIGDLGPSAFRFADFLQETHQRVWQVLPLVPVGYGFSPYASPSTFAGNTLLISPESLRDDGLLTDEDLAGVPAFSPEEVDYDAVVPAKRRLLERAFAHFENAPGEHGERLDTFQEANADWLDDYALFCTLKEAHGDAPWTDWPEPLARRDEHALLAAREEHARTIRMHVFWQYLFDRQWKRLHGYCRERDIRIFGDLPIYVAHDSADVWSHPELFFLEASGHPTVISGVPPDYFSATGQRWGNPLYRWAEMEERNFEWWTRRFEKILERVDIIRLDHFRGFEAFWEIPADEETAVNGRWIDGPREALFEAVEAQLGRLPIVAENLGVITEGVTDLMNTFDFPGMAVLQFAFGSSTRSGFLPHNFRRDLVAYTGTHDNDTIVGWWQHDSATDAPEVTQRMRQYARMYLNMDTDHERSVHWVCIRALQASVAGLVVTPVQDLLGLGSEARMNRPGEESGNWAWRLRPDALSDEVAFRLRALTRIYGRSDDTSIPE